VALLHVAVEGRVQGVGFRWFVRQRARASDLAGWVRNHPDGTVEIAAEGADEVIQRLRREIGRGPDGARVSQIRELGVLGEALERPFAIRK
jgi:acylphosphatase